MRRILVDCYWSAAGEPDQALDALARAVELGYASPFLFIDPDLTSLREEPRFREITVVVQGRLEAGS